MLSPLKTFGHTPAHMRPVDFRRLPQSQRRGSLEYLADLESNPSSNTEASSLMELFKRPRHVGLECSEILPTQGCALPQDAASHHCWSRISKLQVGLHTRSSLSS